MVETLWLDLPVLLVIPVLLKGANLLDLHFLFHFIAFTGNTCFTGYPFFVSPVLLVYLIQPFESYVCSKFFKPGSKGGSEDPVPREISVWKVASKKYLMVKFSREGIGKGS